MATKKPGAKRKAETVVKASRASDAKKTPAAKSKPAAPADASVEAFILALDHPLKPALQLVRRLILAVDPSIGEGIKWNSPSFRTTDWFATINLHVRDRLRLILHTGAKPKASAKAGLKITDPSGLLEWLAKDRCLVTLGDETDVKAKQAALKAIISEWIGQL